MSTRFLAWYSAGAFGLAALLVSAITFVPEREWFARGMMLGLAVAAVVLALLGIVLGSLPPSHWCNRSRPVRVALSVVAVVASLVLLIGIG
jgi:hypothetical protein